MSFDSVYCTEGDDNGVFPINSTAKREDISEAGRCAFVKPECPSSEQQLQQLQKVSSPVCTSCGSSIPDSKSKRENRLKKYQQTSYFRVPVKHKSKSGIRLLLSSIDWLNLVILGIFPVGGIYAIIFIPLSWNVAIWAIIYYYATGLGITAGYHRCFSHRSFKATLPLKILFLCCGAGAMQGSAKVWCLLHRAHHRYTDTEKDPYNALRGFFYSHIGWMVLKQDRNRRIYTDDFKRDFLISFQHRHYLSISIFMTVFFPAIISWYLWGDFTGGFFWVGFLRTAFLQQATFCVNSVAHYFGSASFDDVLTPRDSLFTSLITFGEGYHNFHHEFPNDYRNAIRWWQYDPTKWLINIMWATGLAFDVHCFPENEILKGQLEMKQRKLDAERVRLKWGKNFNELPVWTKEKLQMTLRQDPRKILIIINSMVHDATDFVHRHPGGKELLELYNGKDATEQFNGAVYNHSNVAGNLLSLRRIAKM